MEPVPAEIVEATWQEIAGMSVEEFAPLAERFVREQPYLRDFLMDDGPGMLNAEEQQLLLYMGLVIWQMMERVAGKRLPMVTPESLEHADERNFRAFERLIGKSPAVLTREAEKIVHKCNQVEVLRYVTETLEEDVNEEDDGITEIGKGFIFISLKTVIEALDML